MVNHALHCVRVSHSLSSRQRSAWVDFCMAETILPDPVLLDRRPE
jgi:hypothetical protein